VPEFRTRPDGSPFPLTPKKGKAAGIVATGAVLAGLMTAANGGSAAESVGAALDSAAEQSAKSGKTSSKDAARKGNSGEAWRRIALREIKKTIKQELQCAVQSYGQVQQFFLRTPCTSLDQMLLALSDAQGNALVVSIMWVKMPSTDDADELKKVEDTFGTGDVTPFATEALQLGGIKFTGQHYASRTDGSLVVIAETEPVQGQPSTAVLDAVAEIASVLPPL
jgi:hypothetical protein